MIYNFIGRVVVAAVKVHLRRQYGPTMTPRPVIAGAVVAAVVGVALLANKRSS